MAKISKLQVNLRKHYFDTAECEYCRYFTSSKICKVLEIEVDEEQVCDAYQGAEGKYISFHISESDIPAFARGMKMKQPYKHIVVKGLDTPIGFLIIIRDTMKPKPHTFSIDMDFSNEHLAREHNWTQEEVDSLISRGKTV